GLHCGNERVARAGFLQARDVIYAEHKRSAGVLHFVDDGLLRNLQLEELDHVLLSQDLGGVQQRAADCKKQKRYEKRRAFFHNDLIKKLRLNRADTQVRKSYN